MIPVLGVDPGAKGAVVFRSRNSNSLRFSVISEQVLILRLTGHARRAYVERVASMPKDSRHNAFQFGYNTGWIIGVLRALNYLIIPVESKAWQFEFGLGGKHGEPGCSPAKEKTARKNAHKRKAQELFPEATINLENCDAWLIAEYGFRKENGGLTGGKKEGSKRIGKGFLNYGKEKMPTMSPI